MTVTDTTSASDISELFDGLTLVERRDAWEKCRREVPGTFDPERARRRLDAWRGQAPFNEDPGAQLLAKRLAEDGLDEHLWRRLAGEAPRASADRLDERPAWIETLEAAYAPPRAPSLPPAPAAPGAPPQLMRFLALASPLIQQGREDLREGIAQLRSSQSSLPFDPEGVVDLLYPSLCRRLAVMLGRTLTLELHVAGHRGDLAGETPEARFESFAAGLEKRDRALAILREYPVLARQIVVAIEHWVSFSLDLLHHLAADWPAVVELFAAGEDVGEIVALQSGLGDSHRGGRSVVIIRTGTGFQVVYKPRPMAVDAAFQDFLAWLTERGAEPGLRRLLVLDRGDHGYVEFVAPAPCDNVDEVRRFYRRQGAYLALLQLLDATDFHFENLIAAGEHPVLIDLEALFHPPLTFPERSPEEGLPVGEPVMRSVLRLGLLPQRIWGDEQSAGMDISGLSARGGEQVAGGLLDLDEAGTDRMRFVRRILNLPGAANRPTLKGEEVELTAHRDDVEEGFAGLYRFLLAHRDELLSDDGPLAAFASAEVRVILRPTRAYAMLLGESFHPDLLRSGIDRERFFDRLWVGVAERAYLERLIPHERRSLAGIDVPVFTTRPDSRDLWTDTGERLAGFLGESGLARARRHLELWSEDDLRRQAWLVETSLESVERFAGPAVHESYALPEKRQPASREALLEAARRSCQRLVELAFCDADPASEGAEAWWYDFELLGEDYWTLQPMAPSLYSGVVGIVHFLAYLESVTGDAGAGRLGRAAFRAWQKMLETSFEMTAGVFSGWAGGLYATAHLSKLWDEPAVTELAAQILDRLPAAMASDENLDVIGGVAGAVLGLLAHHRATGSARALELAVQGGERLLARSRPAAVGRGWSTPISEQPLAGFSHGAAGMAWALFDLAAASGEERFRQAAHEAIAYERSVFSKEAGNWPDLRAGRDGGFLVAWCHGAPGIALSRLLALPELDDETTRREIAVAVETTLSQGLGMNLSLCHGDLGQLDILLQAARILGDEALEKRVGRLAAGALEIFEQRGFICGLPRGAKPPGMMLGIAGIGYGFLRLAEPERVPSVLALAPPVA